MGLKDERMKLMNEMLLGIKSIKMYGWESVLKGMIAKARAKEVPTIHLPRTNPSFLIPMSHSGV